MNCSPLESKFGRICIVSDPQHIEVDTNESLPSRFSVAVWLDTSSFTRNARIAWEILGGACQIQAFELCLIYSDTGREVGREYPANPPGSLVNFQSRAVHENKDVCAKFTVDIPPALYPPDGGERTYALVASVTILTTDAMGTKSTILRSGSGELDISSRNAPIFINGVAPGPWIHTRQ
ncbi:hypothetical protein RSOLAG22IIIB_08775 [Rhizoctonia solani]|uniref:Uncharacterized protein n=1 Tax=Rhizoctonia solani TaxID=456999 RepID=A0A0K6FVB5_9AGAM|nr:hypothetical protein RSOLAG22IIIB_08775 [Rhizoctonia solani]